MSELNKESVLLFTGGGKGITAECAVALSSELPCSYVLLGRSEPVSLPDWVTETSSEQEIKQHILTESKANGIKLSPKEIERQISTTHAEVSRSAPHWKGSRQMVPECNMCPQM